MTPKSVKLVAALAAAVLSHAPANAADTRTAPVLTHPSQGDVNAVSGGLARMTVTENGVLMNFESSQLKPNHVHTLWFVGIENPAGCASQPCSGKDVLKNTDVVLADAGFAGGAIADDDGMLRFTHFQGQGQLTNGWFGRGLNDPMTTEIHLVVKDHGPVIEDRLGAMLTTFRDGCTTESINPAFPAIAFADGKEGPNTCALVQFSAFEVIQPAVGN